MLRASRSPRVRARLATIRRIQVFRRRATLEAVQAVQHAEPRLLHDLLRHRAARHVAERDPQHQRAVRIDEGHERVLVACPQARKQLGVVHPRRRCRGVMEVWLAILFAALVGGVGFMLLERWQRPARPADARRSPARERRADLGPAAADVFVLGAALDEA